MKKRALIPYRVPCVWEPSEGQRKKKRTKAVEHSFTRANSGWNGHPQRDISRTGSPSFGDAIPPFRWDNTISASEKEGKSVGRGHADGASPYHHTAPTTVPHPSEASNLQHTPTRA